MQSRFVLLLVLLLLSLIPHSSAAALPSSIRASTRRHLDEDKKDDNDEDEMGDPVITRECEMNADTTEVELACIAQVEDGENEMEDEIDFKIHVDYHGVGVAVEYKQEIESEEMEQETETSFVVKFDRIVEYVKSSPNARSQAYDWQEDTVVKTLYLLEWNDFSPVQTNGVVSHFSVSTLKGIATFNFTISQANHDEHVTANKMKIDFLLNDLSWKERDDTYVALMSKVESERDVELDYEDGDHSSESVMPRNAVISFQQASNAMDAVPFGEFSWETTAQAKSSSVNGTVTVAAETERVVDVASTIQVIATSPPIFGERLPGDKSSEYIAFSFIGEAARSATEIYWDPEAGVGYGTETSSGVGRFSLGLSLLSAIVSTLLFVAF